ncbi:MAG: D-alanyl-D-alanine carboxypeptidase [Armatimonadetes bacterium]|nr:D-alanyl-D-alanine carboxypeptidase [Armatimonadota bacterium]
MTRRTSVAVALAAVLPFVLSLGRAHAADATRQAPPAAGTDRLGLSAQAAILMDVATGQVLYEHNADAPREPASLTKLMTGLLAVEAGDLDRTVTVSKTAADTGEASANLQPGDQLTLRDLLSAALLPSANDASVAIAEALNGSVPSFVERMNARAAELGLRETHFENPHGLPGAGHVSSARDLAVIAREALQHEEFRSTARLEKAKLSFRPRGAKGPQTREVLSTNRLLRHEHPERWGLADGVKTGYTKAAGRCLCASATEDGWQLLAVVLGCTDCWADGRKLLTWGFEQYRRECIVTANATMAQVHIVGGRRPTVRAVAKSSIDLIVPLGESAPTARVSETYAEAPISVGDEVGELVVCRIDGVQLSATLVATEDVPQSLLARLGRHGSALIAAVLVLALLGAVLVHGAVAKAVGARRRRLAQSVRPDREGGARDGQREPGAAPGAEDRRRTRSGAA